MLYLDVQNVYNFQADQPPILVRVTEKDGTPVTDPSDPAKYSLKYISGNLGTVLPSVGIIVEF
jgi:hypothetical protein